MNAPDAFAALSGSACGRSAIYAALSRAFTYEGAGGGALAIAGSDFNEAFDPSVSEEACSLREGSYAGGDQSALFEELMRFYGFFGLGRGERAEMPDHLSVELEFMHFLTHQESRSEGNGEALASLARAQHDFLSRHLLRLVKGEPANLAAALGYYRAFFDPARFSFAYGEAVGPLSQPLLYLHGSRDGCIALDHEAMRAAAACAAPGSEAVLIDNCGHFLQLEQPEEVNRLIGEFLDRARTGDSVAAAATVAAK